MKQCIHQQTLANGLVLLAEEMPWLESAAFALLLPAGFTRDPADRLGLANLTCELMQRGCGSRNSRQFVEDLDRLGAQRSASVGGAHMSFGAAVMAENLSETLSIYADLVRRPHLPKNQLDESRLVCLQEIRATEDDPAQKSVNLVRAQHYPDPWGRTSEGKFEHLEAAQLEDVQRHVATHIQPKGAILSVAGRIDWPRLQDDVQRLLGDWTGQTSPELQLTPAERGYHHLRYPSNQTHLAVAFPCVPYRHPDYFQARGAVGVLSDGMSARLFVEIREKRGLCYTVYASLHSLRDEAAVICYAGTSAERAQETLDVLLVELDRVKEGIEESELLRLKNRVKSALVMQQESSASRSLSMAADWYHCGRIVPLDEISERIANLSSDSIVAYLAEHPPRSFTIATVGPEPLEVTRDLS